MNIKIYLIMVALTLPSCHILQKDKLTLKKLSQKEELQFVGQRKMLEAQNQLLVIDSSDNDFTLVLYPKGKFTFSLATGFEGEAEKVLIKGKQTSQYKLNVKQSVKKDSVAIKANYVKEKEKVTTVKKDKLRVGFNWAWLLVPLIVYFVYRLFKR